MFFSFLVRQLADQFLPGKVQAVDIATLFEPAKKFGTFGSLVSVVLPTLYILAGVVLFFLLIFGGLGIIMGAGGGNPQQADRGKQAFTAALFGFLIIFLSYWIIKIIEVITGAKIVTE